jgi:hypothetical protein
MRRAASSADLSSADLSSADLRSADLSSANLRSADLRYANLRDIRIWAATGNMGEIKSVFLDTYPITYTAEVMQIGCERHAIIEWWEFSDSRIRSMDSKALDWWTTWKPVLQQLITLSPATPIERKEEAAA